MITINAFMRFLRNNGFKPRSRPPRNVASNVITFLLAVMCVGCSDRRVDASDHTSDDVLVGQAASDGCSTGQPNGDNLLGNGTHTLIFEGISRSFRLSVPEQGSASTPRPMILMFHGWGGDENEFLQSDLVVREASQRGYILVAPTGLGSGSPDYSLNSWSFRGSTTGIDGDGGVGVAGSICDYQVTQDYNYASCSGVAQNSCAWSQCQQSDVEFTLSLIKHVSDRLCVDENNVFATGGSNGGMFTWELGQNPASAPTFRAIAPIIGLPHRGYVESQGKDTPMPVLLITGSEDATVPPGAWDDDSYTTTYDGDAFYYESATAITRSWAEAHACDTQGSAKVFEAGFPAADCRTFCEEEANWPTVLDCRSHMPHTYELEWVWPLVLNFFDHHSWRDTP